MLLSSDEEVSGWFVASVREEPGVLRLEYSGRGRLRLDSLWRLVIRLDIICREMI